MSDLWTSSANPLGERVAEITIRYDDDADLVNKIHATADNLGKVANKPVWLVRFLLNCCNGGYP